MERWTKLGITTAICFGAASVGALLNLRSFDDWYPSLKKPSWNPPERVFAPVWSALYLGMAVAAWRIWLKSEEAELPRPLAYFAAQLALNVAWCGVFFSLKQPGWASLEILALWGAILATLVSFWQEDRVAGALMIPYLAWTTFAAALNIAIWRMNDDR
jgi:tryptophan-rich sensory protein